jgi:hypothetical protein
LSETREFRPDDVRRGDRRTLVHRHMDWGSIRADLVKRTGLARQETQLAPKNHVIMINLRGEAKTGEDFVDGRRVAFTPRRPGPSPSYRHTVRGAVGMKETRLAPICSYRSVEPSLPSRSASIISPNLSR